MCNTEKKQSDAAHKLIQEHMDMAKRIALKKKRSLPSFIDVEDLESAAYMGLVEAANRYDISHGVSFSTYSYTRINGAILDWLAEQSYGKRGKFVNSISLESEVNGEDGLQLKDILVAKKGNSCEDLLEEFSLQINQQASDILWCYFVERFTMKEIGEKYNVSESRISQMIKDYKSNLKAMAA